MLLKLRKFICVKNSIQANSENQLKKNTPPVLLPLLIFLPYPKQQGQHNGQPTVYFQLFFTNIFTDFIKLPLFVIDISIKNTAANSQTISKLPHSSLREIIATSPLGIPIRYIIRKLRRINHFCQP